MKLFMMDQFRSSAKGSELRIGRQMSISQRRNSDRGESHHRANCILHVTNGSIIEMRFISAPSGWWSQSIFQLLYWVVVLRSLLNSNKFVQWWFQAAKRRSYNRWIGVEVEIYFYIFVVARFAWFFFTLVILVKFYFGYQSSG